MTTTTLTIDQIEAEFAELEADRESLHQNYNFYKRASEMFPNTDSRVIDVVTLTVISGNVGDLESSQVRRVINALEDGFLPGAGGEEEFFVTTFNEQYPAGEDDLDERAEWENTALVVERDAERGDLRWVFEGA